MSWWRKLFGMKDLTFNPPRPTTELVLGYPFWPIFDSYGAMYRSQPAVRTVVDFLSRNVAQLNPKIYVRMDDTDRREFYDHPVAELLRKPNPVTTRFAHLRDTAADIAIYDLAFWRIERQRGLVRALIRIPPSRLQIEVDPQTLRTVFRFQDRVLSQEELVIFHGYHPDGGQQGVSPLETLRRVLSEEWAASTHREWYWRNSARQGGVIERPIDAPEWSLAAQQRFLADWEATTGGAVNAGRSKLLQDGMHWVPSGFSPKDSEYIEGRKLTYLEVARVYAPSLAGLLGEEGKTATESWHRQLYQDALGPMLRMLQDEIDNQLLSLDEFNFGPAYCEFNLAEKLRGSFEERNRALVSAVGVPYLTINEARAMDNRSRIEGPAFDVPPMPLNVLYGGQPAVTVPLADPGTAAWADFPAKLRAFFERQEQTICSLIGGLKAQGEESVYAAWKEDRWNRELAQLYAVFPEADAWAAATRVNAGHREAAAKAFATGGLEAVRAIFTEAKDNASQFRVRQPALTA